MYYFSFSLWCRGNFHAGQFYSNFFFRFPLKDIYADKAKADEMLRSSSLEWTLVYPVMLTNAPHTGKYLAAEKLPIKGIPKISRADIADFMLQQLTDPAFFRKKAIVKD